MAVKKITLAFSEIEVRGKSDKVDQWRVVKVVNSTAYTPGTYLDSAEVNDLCDSSAWHVTIIGETTP